MTSNLSRYVPAVNPWFEPEIDYTGVATAVFDNPVATVHGGAVVTHDLAGRVSVRLEADRIEYEDGSSGYLLGLAHGLGPGAPSNEVTITTDTFDFPNRCVNLTIETTGGTLRASGDVQYDLPQGLPTATAEGVIRFQPGMLAFEVESYEAASFWVLPLNGFVSDCFDRHPTLDRHPLRIYPTPYVPDDVPADERQMALALAHQHNRLITFGHAGEGAFIERLADYNERVTALKTGAVTNMMTAVMVGSTMGRAIAGDDWQSWLPRDLLNVLSLANGAALGVPWIEFRDADGVLVRRVHARFGEERYARGRPALREEACRGTGSLLTVAQESDYFTSPEMRVALRRTVRAGRNSTILDERISNLIHVFETIRNLRGTPDQYDVTELLGHADRYAAGRILKNAGKELKKLATQAADAETGAILLRMSNDIHRAKQASRGFGVIVEALINDFGFKDVEAAERHFTSHPGPGGRAWRDTVAYYRNNLMHSGSVPLGPDLREYDRLWALSVHLQDILFRMVLTMLGYKGSYTPAAELWPVAKPLDWVTAEARPQDLGYRSWIANN